MKDGRVYPTDLTDVMWAIVAPLLPVAKTKPLQVDLRAVFNAILYIQKTGCQWNMLPKDFPKHQAVRYHFDKWKELRIFEKVNEALYELERQAAGKAEMPTILFMDSQTVQATFVGNDGRGFDGGKKNERAETIYYGR